jgi:cyclohexanone monooxygenase
MVDEHGVTTLATPPTELDAVVVGLGFGGIYMLHKLHNELGLNVRAYDRAGGVGGTWYWNRYPGALSDTESFVYRYSFDDEMLNDGEWTNKYLTQPEILKYLESVVDRFDLRGHIQLSTGIISARYDESIERWVIGTDTGETVTAKYIVNGLGLLSATNVPDIAGIDSFGGEIFHSGAWPEGVELAGKRVAVVGTGSTGLQIITAIAPKVAHLTVFQRSPQYSVPVGNFPVTPESVAAVKKDYAQIWEQVRGSGVAFGFVESTVPAMSVSEAERKTVFQQAWETGGGFRFMFNTFGDIATDPEANEAAASFIRGKIAEIVTDPELVRKLTPTDLYAKRPLCDSGYYAMYNRDNVDLVSLKETPIIEITPSGIKTSDGVEHEIDVLIFATGFDAVDGNYTRMEICGRGGETIQEHWKDGPTSYLGVTTSGFPNMFMILGPNGPFTNLPPSIEAQVEWISQLIKDAEIAHVTSVEPTAEAEEAWTRTCSEIAEMTLFPKADSWIFGANIPGKKKTVMFYLAGLGNYRNKLSEVRDAGYEGFEMKSVARAA